MYIEPNSDIYLIKGCPFDAEYENTGYFTGAAAQQTYFNTLIPIHLSDYYYQRRERGYIRVGLPYSDCYNVNYLMFRNVNATGVTAFENKWWYAFVDSVKYINDSVTELHYTIDVIQSWLATLSLTECFIERQHSVTDGIGDNIIDEGFSMGEYVFNEYDRVNYGNPNNVLDRGYYNELAVIVAVCDTRDTAVDGIRMGGAYSGAKLYAFNQFAVSVINSFLATYLQRPDAIVAMYTCPMSSLPSYIPYNQTQAVELTSNLDYNYHEYSWTQLSSSSTLDGTYVPKNKKLYTYPYNYVGVNTPSGDGNIYRYEFFDNLTPSFVIYDTCLQPVSVKLFPNNYKNVRYTLLNPAGDPMGIHNPVLTNESLSLSGYPMCSWNTDSYKAWCAQQTLLERYTRRGAQSLLGEMKNSYSYNELSNKDWKEQRSPNLYTGLIEAGNTLSGVPYIGKIFNCFADEYKASIAADIYKGSNTNNNIDAANGNMCFNIGRISITKQKAKMIDDFFTMYGYAQKTVGRPNIHARTRWTYVKTIGCQVDEFSTLPHEDKMAIQAIFDNGVRFWVNPSEIGNYSLTNNVLI